MFHVVLPHFDSTWLIQVISLISKYSIVIAASMVCGIVLVAWLSHISCLWIQKDTFSTLHRCPATARRVCKNVLQRHTYKCQQLLTPLTWFNLWSFASLITSITLLFYGTYIYEEHKKPCIYFLWIIKISFLGHMLCPLTSACPQGLLDSSGIPAAESCKLHF